MPANSEGSLLPAQFEFGLDYIATHFGSNVALATQQMTQNRYRRNPQTLIDLILTSMDLSGTESVADLGCGNGFILRDLVSRLREGGSAVALDVSPTMLELARANVNIAWVPVTFVEGRAEDLSDFGDGQFQRVMANFIFHYIDDPDVVLAEMSRVRSDDGLAILTIEARGSMGEMYKMHFDGMQELGFPPDFISRLPRGRRGVMTLDNAEQYLRRHFSSVREIPYEDELRFETVAPFMDFYATGHKYCGAKAMADDEIPDGLLSALHQDVESKVGRLIAENGHFTLSKQNSVFVCS